MKKIYSFTDIVIMELLILHSEAEKSRLGPLRELLRKVHIAYSLCPVKAGAGPDSGVLSCGENRPTHLIVISSGKADDMWWICYALGYVRGMGNTESLCFVSDPVLTGYTGDTEEVDRLISRTGAAAVKNLDRLKAYLQREVEKFTVTERAETAKKKLFEAGLACSADSFEESVKKGNTEAVRLFLEAGFSPDTVNRKGVPMLNRAVRNEQYEVFLALLDAGADVDAKSGDNGNTPLMEAVFVRDAKIINKLLDCSCDLDRQNKNGQTALIVSVANGYTEIAEELILNNADISPRDGLGMTARKYAELFHHTQIMTLLDPELAS